MTGGKRWALGGVLVGTALALLVGAPAAWLAGAVASATDQRLLLADARGSLWQGSATVVLTGGAGSRDASALPDRLHWTLAPDGAGLLLRARQACCINGELRLRLRPGLGRLRVELPPADGAASGNPADQRVIGQWPAAWLVGLGTPWNTLQPSGWMQLRSPGLGLEQVQGRWRFDGRADLELVAMASRLSTLDVLGSYRISLIGDAGGDSTQVQLSTLSGALQLLGNGSLLGAGAASRLRFQGQATAAPGAEASLGNLLNIIGRRQGALSVISIG